MPVSLEVFKVAMQRVQALYKEEPILAKKERREKRGFNELIRLVVRPMHLRDSEYVDLVHELAVFFGRRGGKTPHAKKETKTKRSTPNKKCKGFLRPEPVELSKSLQNDLLRTARQANEHICPIN